MKIDFNWKYGIATCALLALAGCGGTNAPIITGDTVGTPGNTGGTGTTTGTGTTGGTTANTVPASAYASIDAFFAYVQQIVASNSDTATPVQIGDNAVPPVSDTAAAKNF